MGVAFCVTSYLIRLMCVRMSSCTCSVGRFDRTCTYIRNYVVVLVCRAELVVMNALNQWGDALLIVSVVAIML